MSRIAKNILLVLFGRGSLLALSLVAYALIFRVLDVADAGRFAMCMVMVRVLSDCLAEPLDMAVMREVPTALATDREQAFRIVRTAFLIRITVASLVVTVTSLLAPWIAAAFFHSSQDADLVIVSALGAGGVLLMRSNLVYFQCEENFLRVIFVDAVLQIGRLAAIVALAAGGMLTARSGIVFYVLVTYVTFAAGVFLLPPAIRKLTWRECGRPDSMLHYAKWMIGVTLLAAVYERLNEFLIARFHGPGQLAFYAAAMTLAMLPEFMTGCLSSVYQPRAIVAYNQNELRALRWSYLRIAVPAGICVLILGLLLADPVITIVFGADYRPAVPAFRLLGVATLSWLMLAPLSGILVILLAPRVSLLLNIMMFLITLGSGCWLIPRYGVTGAAALFLGARWVNVIALWRISEHLLRRNERPLIAGVSDADQAAEYSASEIVGVKG
jgi:stage V sporulation protein B